jgi:MoxR-like ATPase
MQYTKLFDVQKSAAMLAQSLSQMKSTIGDRRDGLVYVYTDEIELTINVALAIGRPILLRGPSGVGKSSLARNVALRLGRRYYELVITSKTQHTDLLWHFDLLKRFRDAQTAQLKPDADYIEPRALWWAFDPSSAARRGLAPPREPEHRASDPSSLGGESAVVLIDEIDKADPDVPNNLLVTLGSLQFSVPELNDLNIEAAGGRTPLVFITSNDERALPVAFLRRCVVIELARPGIDRLLTIAAEHFGHSAQDYNLYKAVADVLYGGSNGPAPAVSTAEYLDTVLTCRQLKIVPESGNPAWDAIARITVQKQRSSDEI